MDDNNIDKVFGILRKPSKFEMEILIQNVFLKTKEAHSDDYNEYIDAKQKFLESYGWTIRTYNLRNWDE